MAHERILIVDDEEDVLELVRYNLEKNGYTVETAATGEEALKKVRFKKPDLMVLDLMLPGVDGLNVCKQLKSDPVTGLELGADDYVTKPFSPKVLVARIRRRLHQTSVSNTEAAPVNIYELTIDPSRRQVLIDDTPVDLTYTEFNILLTLARRPGMVFTRYQIVDAIHGNDYLVTDRAVDVQMVGLRKKLGSCGTYIETVRGVGYRFKE
ncbi:MAG: response regulator transcription factor [Planctomycetota bacterium]|jgi:two-component system phosphate regulon response regulator PhoB